MPDEHSDKGILLFGSLAFARPGGPSPLFPERPNPAVHPLQPAIVRAELPCATAARTTPSIGVPLRVWRAPVERASWPSFLVFSRGDGPPGEQKRNLEMQNLVILAGNVGATPEVRTTQGGTKITNFSLATSRPKRDQDGKTMKDGEGRRVEDTEWHRITCFNGVGKTVAQYVEKGQKVMVRGRIHYTRWTDDQNIERYGVEIIADEVTFLSYGKSRQERQGAAQDDEADDVPF